MVLASAAILKPMYNALRKPKYKMRRGAYASRLDETSAIVEKEFGALQETLKANPEKLDVTTYTKMTDKYETAVNKYEHAVRKATIHDEVNSKNPIGITEHHKNLKKHRQNLAQLAAQVEQELGDPRTASAKA